MKKIFLSFCFIALIGAITFAQAPATFKYQAVLRDANGNVRANENITVNINIIPSTSETVVYTENHSVKTNEFGVFTLEIGKEYEDNFANIDWSSKTYSLTIEINGQLFGTSDILSVPVARYAEAANYNKLTNKPSFSAVAISGNYNDLSNTPDFADVATSGSYSDLSEKPDFAAVATSGNYNDLNNRPLNLVTKDSTQTITGQKTFTKTITAQNGIDSKTKKITNVGTPTASGDAVNKAYTDSIIANLLDIIEYSQKGLYDVDGNNYNTVLIGDQFWMADDLKVKKLKNATPITNASNNNQWANLGVSAYCQNSDGTRILYNWLAVSSGNLCPSGWHIPSEAEFQTLLDFLGGAEGAKSKLLNGGTSGYKASYNGYVKTDGVYDHTYSNHGYWWSSSSPSQDTTFYLFITTSNNDAHLTTEKSNKHGFSVRCVKD
ncbi:MAG: fibrobacter succinogenes major paralogous domain-containing protein [Bacteroidales bacterium]|nr:fibrobacter succinogenes major paralogous domain-containing protein [Bacteroidales bacterium]